MYDLLIRNGTVIDGSGRKGFVADVAISGDRIVGIGKPEDQARRVIDATGLAVTPGFIDIHTHYDVQAFFDRSLAVSPWHGVTTVAMGNCGVGIAPTKPEDREWVLRNLQHVEGMDFASTSAGMGDWGFETFPEYLDALERRQLAINSAVLVGHVPMKMYVVGKEAAERLATDDEIAQMKVLVTEALRAGALGFSTNQTTSHFGEGGLPIASRITTLEELIELAAPLEEQQAGVFHMAGGDIGAYHGEWLEKIAESLPSRHSIGRGIHCRRNMVHREWIAYHEALHARGLHTYGQFDPLPMQFEASMLDPFFPFVDLPPQLDAEPCTELMAPVITEQRPEERLAMYRADGFRERFREDTSRTNWTEVFNAVSFSAVPGHPDLDQRTLLEVGKEQGVHPTDYLLDLQFNLFPQIARINCGHSNLDEDEVAWVLNHPSVVLGNGDAGAHVQQMLDARFPTYVLGKYVRDRGDLTLEHAIKKLTSEGAEVLGIKDRGLLAEGMKADVVVFDPTTVSDGPLKRNFDFPAGGSHLVSEAIGVEHVVVNGVSIREQGRDAIDPDGPMPGQVIRNAAR